MCVLQCVQTFACVGVPDLAVSGVEISISLWGMVWGFPYAEKSAAAVAEMAASAESLACHTAPLWPRKVPILGSDVSGRYLGQVSFAVPVSGYAIAEHGVIIFSKLVNAR